MSEKLTLQDIVDLLSEKQGISRKEAELLVRSMFDLIEEALTTDKYVKIKGLGAFKLTEVDSRESVNVNTGERIEIQGHTKISFTPDATMKELINKPFSHFETVILNDGVLLNDTPDETQETLEAEEKPVEKAIIEETKLEEEVIIPENQKESPVIEEDTPEEVQIAEEQEPEPVIEEEVIPMNEEIQAPETLPEASEEIKENPIEEPVQTIPTEEPAEQTEETPDVTSSVDEPKKSSSILGGIIIVLVLIILFGAYWLFLRPSDTSEIVPVTPIKQETVVTTDSIEKEAPQEAPVVKEEPQPVVPKNPQPVTPVQTTGNERVPSLADTLDYQITGTKTTYTLQNGETIIKASVKFFGTKKFWPYIVKHNQDAIKDADNIPAGISIKIPELAPRN